MLSGGAACLDGDLMLGVGSLELFPPPASPIMQSVLSAPALRCAAGRSSSSAPQQWSRTGSASLRPGAALGERASERAGERAGACICWRSERSEYMQRAVGCSRGQEAGATSRALSLYPSAAAIDAAAPGSCCRSMKVPLLLCPVPGRRESAAQGAPFAACCRRLAICHSNKRDTALAAVMAGAAEVCITTPATYM